MVWNRVGIETERVVDFHYIGSGNLIENKFSELIEMFIGLRYFNREILEASGGIHS
jgi:hypothetical protein